MVLPSFSKYLLSKPHPYYLTSILFIIPLVSRTSALTLERLYSWSNLSKYRRYYGCLHLNRFYRIQYTESGLHHRAMLSFPKEYQPGKKFTTQTTVFIYFFSRRQIYLLSPKQRINNLIHSIERHAGPSRRPQMPVPQAVSLSPS